MPPGGEGMGFEEKNHSSSQRGSAVSLQNCGRSIFFVFSAFQPPERIRSECCEIEGSALSLISVLATVCDLEPHIQPNEQDRN